MHRLRGGPGPEQRDYKPKSQINVRDFFFGELRLVSRLRSVSGLLLTGNRRHHGMWWWWWW